MNNDPYVKLLGSYQRLYGLREVVNKTDVTPQMLEYCQQGSVFVVIALCDDHGRFYFRHALNKFRGWELLGGFVHEDDQSLEEAAMRIVRQESGFEVDELRPLLSVVNIFQSKDTKYAHRGLAYIASVRPQHLAYRDAEYVGGWMKQTPLQVMECDVPVYSAAKQHLTRYPFHPPHNEIDEARHLGWRYVVHRRTVQPIQRLVVSRVLQKEITRDLRGRAVLDVSCGDDAYIVKIANAHPTWECVANDISWKSVEMLFHHVKQKNILFTNHDLNHLPYRQKFDTVIFKNSLHHLKQNRCPSNHSASF